MARERMVRAMLDALVDKAINDIKDDPERGFRNVVDLALGFNGGHFSKTLFEMIQKMLSDETSAYYRLIKTISNDVANSYFKGFTMNVGFNSCSKGAKIIRRNEKELGLSIPWCISFGTSCGELWPEFSKNVVSQSKELGVYLYSIYNNVVFSPSSIELYKSNSDCAFILFADASEITDENINLLNNIDNILISIRGKDAEKLNRAANVLRNHGRFFSYHVVYKDDNYEELLSPASLKSMEYYTNSFVFFIPDFSCGEEAHCITKKAVKKLRDEQRYAFVPIDMKADVKDIDKVISESSVSIIFSNDGNLLTVDGSCPGRKYNAENIVVKDLFASF
ncbi:MAG: hypothetical protein PUD43_02030 [Clostridia bacterium]|nr:hypothetical protein [Clostridia bacterium]